MTHVVPWDAFEGCPLVISDARGRVSLCNAAAESLLGDRLIDSRPCWEALRIRTRCGDPFCSPDCPIQSRLRRGELRPRQWLVRLPRNGHSVDLELLSFPIPSPRTRRRAVLHLMLPARPDEGARPPVPARHLERLSQREHEVLSLLASGISTPAMAQRLCISVTTVRNHVQHILRKLEVHGRLEAVAALHRRRERGRKS